MSQKFLAVWSFQSTPNPENNMPPLLPWLRANRYVNGKKQSSLLTH